MIPSTSAVLLLASVLPAQGAEPRPAVEILRDFDRVVVPSSSEGSDAASTRRFREEVAKACQRKADLALEMFAAYPDHERVSELLATRWAGITNAVRDPDAVAVETADLLATSNVHDDVKREAMRARAHALIESDTASNVQRIAAVRELVAVDPESESTGICLFDLAHARLGDPAQMKALLEQAAEQWPESVYVGRPAKNWLRVLENVGNPFLDAIPPDGRAAFEAETREPASFTVVQVWMGWLRGGADDPELAGLKALRHEFGESVRVVGLLYGDLDERLPAARAAGMDWPQLAAPRGRLTPTPGGVPSFPCYFVLDRDLVVVGVTGRAAAAAVRLRRLRSV